MIKASLEKFDTPVVIINQVFEGENWGVVASYVSPQDVTEAGSVESQFQVGWHVSITLPNLDDMDFTRVFTTPEAALEFGISQILSGKMVSTATSVNRLKGKVYPFGHYLSIVPTNL